MFIAIINSGIHSYRRGEKSDNIHIEKSDNVHNHHLSLRSYIMMSSIILEFGSTKWEGGVCFLFLLQIGSVTNLFSPGVTKVSEDLGYF